MQLHDLIKLIDAEIKSQIKRNGSTGALRVAKHYIEHTAPLLAAAIEANGCEGIPLCTQARLHSSINKIKEVLK